jgi:predicted nucleic acid-binding protein
LILVDTSVWVDWLRGNDTTQTAWLERERERTPLVLGDLILAELLQGVASEQAADSVLRVFSSYPFVLIGGRIASVAAAANYRRLRALGITPCKTIDTLIATRCMLDETPLLHADRDFDPFERHLGLKVVKTD